MPRSQHVLKNCTLKREFCPDKYFGNETISVSCLKMDSGTKNILPSSMNATVLYQMGFRFVYFTLRNVVLYPQEAELHGQNQ